MLLIIHTLNTNLLPLYCIIEVSSLRVGKAIYTSLCTSWRFAGGGAVLQQFWQNDCLSHYYEEEVIACEKQHNMWAPKQSGPRKWQQSINAPHGISIYRCAFIPSVHALINKWQWRFGYYTSHIKKVKKRHNALIASRLGSMLYYKYNKTYCLVCTHIHSIVKNL